jgi:hypothetical protein
MGINGKEGVRWWLDVRDEKALYLGCVNVGGGLQEVYETASSPLVNLFNGTVELLFSIVGRLSLCRMGQ